MAEKVSILVTLKDGASKGLKGLTKGVKSLATAPFKIVGKGFTSVFRAATSLKGLIAGAAFTGTIAKISGLWKEQNDVLKQTEARLKSTGGASGLTADEINKMAGELQKVTNFGDEVTQSGQNLLLTFTNIGKDVFPKATETMLDMSTAMGTDVKSSAMQLGKALNDPIKGMASLSEAGVQFTDEQKEQIRVLQESGDMVGAQNIILKELETQFGGSARAAADSFTQMKNGIGDVGEMFGEKLQPAIDLFAKIITDWINSGAAEIFAEQFGKGVLFIVNNFNNLRKGLAFTNNYISLKFNEISTNLQLFAVSTEEIIKRPFQFETYKKVFTVLVDRIAELTLKIINLRKNLFKKGLDALLGLRENYLAKEEKTQITYEDKIQQIKQESKNKQIEIENKYQTSLDEINAAEKERKKNLELEKIRELEKLYQTSLRRKQESADAEVKIEENKTNKSIQLTKKEKEAREQLTNSILDSAQTAAASEKDILKATGNFYKDQLKKQVGAYISARQAELASYAAANFWNPMGWLAAAGVLTLEAGKNEAYAAIDRFQDGGIVNGSRIVGDTQMVRVNSGELILNKAQQRNLASQLFGIANNQGSGGNNNSLIKEIKMLREEMLQPREIKLNANSFAKATYQIQRRQLRTGQISGKV